MIINIHKWRLDDESAAKFIERVQYSPEKGEYWEDWNICGFQFSVRFDCPGFLPHTTPNSTDRWWGLVSGEKLGGFVGVSYGPDDDGIWRYHIGTPNGICSKRLIAAMEQAMKEEEEGSPSPPDLENFFQSRNLLRQEEARIKEERREKGGDND